VKRTLVSIIVPVYNVEEYLTDCIDSILAQSEKVYEIILVDDGSTDDSLAICYRYAESNSHIRVFHQSNMGVSAARNLGINRSLGEYIMFVDSDDIVAPDIIKILLETLESTKTDISISKVYPFIDNLVIPHFKPSSKLTILSSSQALERLFNQSGILNGVYSRMYKKSLFTGERFTTGTSIGEDLEMSYRLLLKASRISIVECYLYYYRQRQDSVMHNSDASKKLQVLDVARIIIDDIEENKPNLSAAAHTMLFYQALFIMNSVDIKNNEVKKLMGKYGEIIKTSAKETMTSSSATKKIRLYATMFSAFPKFTMIIIYSKNNLVKYNSVRDQISMNPRKVKVK
jgi:glycosyltransferase involved in cell wall biosynthesis